FARLADDLDRWGLRAWLDLLRRSRGSLRPQRHGGRRVGGGRAAIRTGRPIFLERLAARMAARSQRLTAVRASHEMLFDRVQALWALQPATLDLNHPRGFVGGGDSADDLRKRVLA